MNGSLFLEKLVFVLVPFQILSSTFLPKPNLSYPSGKSTVLAHCQPVVAHSVFPMAAILWVQSFCVFVHQILHTQLHASGSAPHSGVLQSLVNTKSLDAIWIVRPLRIRIDLDPCSHVASPIIIFTAFGILFTFQLNCDVITVYMYFSGHLSNFNVLIWCNLSG